MTFNLFCPPPETISLSFLKETFKNTLMKHLKKSIAVFAGIALLFSACKKDDPGTIPPPEPIPSSVELQTYFDQNIF